MQWFRIYLCSLRTCLFLQQNIELLCIMHLCISLFTLQLNCSESVLSLQSKNWAARFIPAVRRRRRRHWRNSRKTLSLRIKLYVVYMYIRKSILLSHSHSVVLVRHCTDESRYTRITMSLIFFASLSHIFHSLLPPKLIKYMFPFRLVFMFAKLGAARLVFWLF